MLFIISFPNIYSLLIKMNIKNFLEQRVMNLNA